VYRPNVHPKFPQGGKITPYLEKLEIGDRINIDGPFGRFDYKQGGRILIEGK
jgi:cytochrome-b5 reductase